MNLSLPVIFWPRCEKTCLPGFANNTGADEPAHPCSLISAFVIRLSSSIISRLATSEIINFLAGLWSLRDWFETGCVGNPEDRFSRDSPFYKVWHHVWPTITSQNYIFYGYCLSSILERLIYSKIYDIYDFGNSSKVYNTGFPQAWKVLEFRGVSWKVLEN